MVSPYYIKTFEKAVKEGRFVIPCLDSGHARSFRQRLYRMRERLRESESPLAAVVDDLKFTIDGKQIIVVYSNPEDVEAIKRGLNS